MGAVIYIFWRLTPGFHRRVKARTSFQDDDTTTKPLFKGILDRLRFLPIKKMDQRTSIKFCVKNEIKCADAFRMLTVANGEATLDRSNVYRWYKMFSEGREDVNDEERAGRPSTSTTDEKINEVEKMILANRRITVREVSEDLNISIGSCHSIFINDLGMRRVAAKFVPKLLNCDQKQHRLNIANEMLDSVRDDPNLLQRVITGDEVWVYGYDVETKAQSSQWKLPHEPRPKKARQVRSNVKVLLTVFFDCRGVVHHEFLPQGRTVNKEYYLQVMRNLREAIRQKRPDLWKNKNWLLHHDNAPAHTSLLVRDFLAKNNTLMMPQPPYSPELAPCDFFLFPKLKRPMKGRRYATLDEIKTASKEELKKIFKNDFLKCFENWKTRWHKCIISHGDYFDGDKIAWYKLYLNNQRKSFIYWSCKRIRPLIIEVFSVLGRSPDLRAWIFGSGLEDDNLAILASAKSIIYRYFVQVGLTGGPLIAWERRLTRRSTSPA
ncbi:hypothetical protein LAZ67_1000678 [Cordylochernes scorpioides]|uniref:Transposase n=1 Tax=Cordylochernes scorpioides TaxID=51811 RepID=A0ABY6JUV4_9ARAC|nr:hypothetical protein LAZ67_1000678 [Cordylochernes scorpioides]